jgi:hypothetical protein
MKIILTEREVSKMTLARLIDIRDRLALLTQPEPSAEGAAKSQKSDRELNIERELAAAVQSLDQLITEVREELISGPSFEKELSRTTSLPLKPPTEAGPHEIKWGL